MDLQAILNNDDDQSSDEFLIDPNPYTTTSATTPLSTTTSSSSSSSLEDDGICDPEQKQPKQPHRRHRSRRGSSHATNAMAANLEMDLERILRESDDEDDDDEDVQDLQGGSIQHRCPPLEHYHGDDIDDDADKVTLASTILTTEQHFLGNSSKPITLLTTSMPNPLQRSYNPPVSSADPIPHSAQEWAVLQAILGEDEEDDDDDPLDSEEWVVEDKKSDRNHRTQSIVDAILVSSSSDEDEVDTENKAREVLPLQSLNPFPLRSQPPSTYYENSTDATSPSPLLPSLQLVDRTPNGQKTPIGDSTMIKSPPSSSHIPVLFENLSTIPSQLILPAKTSVINHNYENKTVSLVGNDHHRKDTADDEDARWFATSVAALSHAQAYERRLLRPAPRDTIVSPLQVKRRLKPKLQVQSKMQKLQQQQQQQQQIRHTLVPPSHHQTNSMSRKFCFSGVVDLQRMPKISAVLSRNLDSQHQQLQVSSNNRGVGLPTAVAVNSKFIAVGTQGGVILVFDLFEVLRQELGRPTGATTTPMDTTSQVHIANNSASSLYNSTTTAMMTSTMTTTTTTSSVSSLDLAKNGEVIIAGYTNGMLVLWDCIKGSPLRTVYDLHPSPITSVRFVASSNGASANASASDTFKVVSVDAGGLVYKVHFSRNMLYGYSMDTDCLLDGTAGQILAMNVLAPYPGGGGTTINNNHRLTQRTTQRKSHPMEKIVLIGLSSERSSFCVAVEPAIHVLHRWAKPAVDRILPPGHAVATNSNTDTAAFLPCLSWEWALVSGGGHALIPILARSWGCCLQLLRASFSSPDDDESPSRKPQQKQQWPAFGVHDEFEASAPVVAMEWLNERSLLYLTITNECAVVDTVMMTLLERLDFSDLALVYAEFSLSRSSSASSSSSSSAHQVSYSTTFQNSIRASDDRILVLCQNEVKNISIVGAKQRILALEQDGEWLEALALALDHYENTVKSQEDRRRDPERRLLKHPEFVATRSDDEEWIAKLLARYLNLAVENAPDAVLHDDQMEISRGKHQHDGRIDLTQSHFQMLAGVCVEFCVVTRRLDMLYGSIFRRFQSAGFTNVFLDVMEPYVLSDKLDYIAPEVMAHFVEHCKATNGIATVERCLLHMDVTIMDFDSIISLLRKNGMYSALFYVFNQGLNDFITPLEMILDRLFEVVGDRIHKSIHRDGFPQTDFDHLGYKAILYLRHCFTGKSFPQETDLQPENRRVSLRPELLRFLLNESYSPSSSLVSTSNKSATVVTSANRSTRYPYLHVLLLVDPRAMLDALSLALDAPDSEFELPNTAFESIRGWEVEVGAELTDSLLGSPRSTSVDSDVTALCPDRQRIISVLLSLFLPESPSFPIASMPYQSTAAQNAFLDFLSKYLMKGVVRTDKNVTFLILSRMAAKYATEKEPSLRLLSQSRILELLSALPQNAYEADEVLALVQSAGIHRASLLLHQEGASSWHEGIDDFRRRSHHFVCAINCYLEDDDQLFRNEVFEYIKKECSGSSESPLSEGQKSESLRDAVVVKLADLVHLDPMLSAELVADLFIENFDAVVSSLGENDDKALYIFLDAIISGEMNQVDPVACSVLNANLSMDHHHQYLSLMAMHHPELVYCYLSTHDNYRVDECLKLCQEHDIADASAYLLERMGNVSSALQLLLQTLESKMMTLKRTIRGIGIELTKSTTPRRSPGSRFQCNAPKLHPRQEKELESLKRTLVVALDLCERNSGTWSTRSEQGSQLWFNVLDRLINAKGFLRLSKEQTEHADVLATVLSDILRLTMQRMVSCVPLPDIVHKVTSDHSGGRLGELREMIDGLLGTYRFELEVFDGAHKTFRDDVRILQRKTGALRRSGSCIRKVTRQPISELSGINSLTDHSVSSFTALVAANQCDAVLLGSRHPQSGRSASEYGFGFALEQLRSRRLIQSSDKLDQALPCTKLKQGRRLNMMTEADRTYVAGESSEAAYFGERLVSSLGEAEHRGSLAISYL